MAHSEQTSWEEVAAALRQISRGFAALADAISPTPTTANPDDRYRALLAEWGERGLNRAESSALFRRHGFSPQAAGGWVRGDWLETGSDGLRYLTERSRAWLADQEDLGGQNPYQGNSREAVS